MVLRGSDKLILGTDFTAKGEFDNAKAGTGKTVTITVTLGASVTNYTIESAFTLENQTIEKANQTLTVSVNAFTKTYGDGEFSLNCTTTGNGKITYSSDDESVVTISEDGIVTIVGAGNATVTVTFADGANYACTDSKTISITIAKKTVDVPSVPTTVFTYTGTEQTYAIAESSFYTVTGNKQTNAGSCPVTITLCLWKRSVFMKRNLKRKQRNNIGGAKKVPPFVLYVAQFSIVIF